MVKYTVPEDGVLTLERCEEFLRSPVGKPNSLAGAGPMWEETLTYWAQFVSKTMGNPVSPEEYENWEGRGWNDVFRNWLHSQQRRVKKPDLE